ncbi:MAG: DUF1127 domain-containing protein [Pseudomonadota bacterium]
MMFVDKSARNWRKTLWTELSAFRRMLDCDALANAQSDTVYKALNELRDMPDYQLVDIGLSRSDLTPEGLATAGMRRRAKQRAISIEIARMAEAKARQWDGT